MAILGKDGQLIANASQRTIVFESEEMFEEFRASLPDGANIFQSFDIYIRESGQMYAAGVPFKLRETVLAPMELHVSTDGKGDGSSVTRPLNANQLQMKLMTLAANYDFNNNPLSIKFAPGSYGPLTLATNFINCGAIEIMPEDGYETLYTKEDEYEGYAFDETKCVVFSPIQRGGIWAGYTISSWANTYVNIQNVGIVCRDGGLQAKGAAAHINIYGCAFQMIGATPMNKGYYAVINATQGATIMVGYLYGVINWGHMSQKFLGEDDPAKRPFIHDAFMMADYSGIIQTAAREDVFQATMVDGTMAGFFAKRAIVMANDLGTVKMQTIKPQTALTTGRIDECCKDIFAMYDSSGWATAKRNGVLYLPAEGNVPHATFANCDNTSSIIKEGEE